MSTNNYLPSLYQQFIHKSRYARWLWNENRRETWEETVARFIKFFDEHLLENNKYQITKEEKDLVEQAILSLQTMPSMRCLMTAGEALKRENVSGYNCSYIAIDSPRSFDEIVYILMNGTGVGFSVEQKYTDQLPMISDEFYDSDTTIVVSDSKLGWSKAVKEIIHLLYSGQVPKWDLSKLRPAGAPLKTFGGRASGPAPLNDLFVFLVNTFKKAAGRKLTTLECHDIVCKIAEIVVVGGVRRCLPKNQRIQTLNGYQTIENIKIGDIIITGGKEYPVIEKVYSGKQKILNIYHKFGMLPCTENHEVAIFDRIGNYTFKAAKDICVNDTLVWDGYGINGSKQKLPVFTQNTHFNSKPIVFPEYLNEDIAWLIGIIHGDGYIGKKTIEISGNLNDWDMLDHAKNLFLKYFNIDGKLSKDSHEGNGIRLRLNSKSVAEWFYNNIKQSNTQIKIPSWIFASTKEVRMSYLMGLFDADGRITSDGGIDQCTTIYKEFKDDIITLLSGLGIASRIYFRDNIVRREEGIKSKDYYTIRIVGKTNKEMWKNFKYLSKSQKIQKIKDFIGTNNDFSYPKHLHDGVGYHNNDMSMTAILDKGLTTESKFYPTKVIDIEECETEIDTYDIEVGIAHQFTTEGIVVHNSALISLSDISDDRMRLAKSGDWWKENVQRALANNSYVAKEKVDVGIFMREWISLYESRSGERGIFSRLASKKQAEKFGRRDPNFEFGTNPCSEIILRSREFCNLSEVVVRENDTIETLKEKVRIAAIIGTWQSTLTNFKYITKKWKENCEEERLLGVSLTGIMDCNLTNGKTKGLENLLEDLKKIATDTNKEWALKLNIPYSAAVTCVKPSGCADKDTKIKTSNGIMSLEEIFNYMGYDIYDKNQGTWLKPLKELFVYDENNNQKKITNLFVNGMSKVYEIKDELGNIHKFTGEHKIKTYNKGWVRVDCLQEGDDIITF